MNPASVGIGISGGLGLSFAVVVFAVVGLGPWFTWVPDEILLIAAAASAVIYLGMAGARARAVTGSLREGASAAALSGAIAGIAAGVCYLIFGKSVASLIVLPIIGAGAGAIIGSAAAWVRR